MRIVGFKETAGGLVAIYTVAGASMLAPLLYEKAKEKESVQQLV
jgi:hypothetical protein